jgi:hypothetical protein
LERRTCSTQPDLPANVMNRWFHRYLILDLYSRKIIGAEVHDSDNADYAVHPVRLTAPAEAIAHPVDTRLLENARHKVVSAAKRCGIGLKQTYVSAPIQI